MLKWARQGIVGEAGVKRASRDEAGSPKVFPYRLPYTVRSITLPCLWCRPGRGRILGLFVSVSRQRLTLEYSTMLSHDPVTLLI
jgi:hypothetical protein